MRLHAITVIVLAAAAVLAAMWCIPSKPPVLIVRGSELDYLTLDLVAPGDWVEYDQKVSPRVHSLVGLALLRADASGFWLETSGLFNAPPGDVVVLRLKRDSLDIEEAWVGTPGSGGRKAILQRDPNWRPPKVGLDRYMIRDGDERTGRTELVDVDISGRRLRCEKVQVDWDYGRRASSEESRPGILEQWKYVNPHGLSLPGTMSTNERWWAREVPRFHASQDCPEPGQVQWNGPEPMLKGGLVKGMDLFLGYAMEEDDLVDFGHEAKPSIRIPALK